MRLILLLIPIFIYAKCFVLPKRPILYSSTYPAVLLKDKTLLVFDSNLNLKWQKKFNAKINSIKVYKNTILLTGLKDSKFWIAKITKNKTIQKTYFNTAEGFDIVKIHNGYVAVGYKIFDHIGNIIKRFVILKLDKNLNLINSKTFGNYKSTGLKIFKQKPYLYIFVKMKKIFIVKFNYNIHLINYKLTDFKVIYDIRKFNNQILFTTEKNGLYDYDINKNKIFKLTSKNIDYIINPYKYIICEKSKNYLINNNQKKLLNNKIAGVILKKSILYLIEKDKKNYLICKY